MRNLIVLITLLSLSLIAFAEEVVKVSDTRSPLQVTVLQSTAERVVVKFEIGSFTKQAFEINGKTYYSISTGESNYVPDKGMPDLPRICRSIIISDTDEMELKVLSAEYKEFTNMPIVPSKGIIYRDVDPATVPYEFGALYSSGEWSHDQVASMRTPHIQRDVRGTVVDINAFQYNSNQDTLRVYTSVVVEIGTVGRFGTNALIHTRTTRGLVNDFKQMYQNRYLNYAQYREAQGRYKPVPENAKLLIITRPDYDTAMDPFVTHKEGLGMTVTKVTTAVAGTTASAIKAYVQNKYDSEGISFVLLVGDHQHIPAFSASAGYSDSYYSLVAGSDDYPDLFVGRFSAESVAHVTAQVEKTIAYETVAIDGWAKYAMGVASDQGPGGGGTSPNGSEKDYEHNDKILALLGNNGYSTRATVYDPNGTAANVTTAINAGVGIINYTGHGSSTSWGSSGFSNSNIRALGNSGKYPLIVSVACVNGQFYDRECFGEVWLRESNKGAAGCYASTINQSWVPPMDAQDEAMVLLCNGSYLSFGALCYMGSCNMMDIQGSGGIKMFQTWVLFGDPSIKVRK